MRLILHSMVSIFKCKQGSSAWYDTLNLLCYEFCYGTMSLCVRVWKLYLLLATFQIYSKLRKKILSSFSPLASHVCISRKLYFPNVWNFQLEIAILPLPSGNHYIFNIQHIKFELNFLTVGVQYDSRTWRFPWIFFNMQMKLMANINWFRM